MSNINPELEYDNLSDWFEFLFRQSMKGINTSLPGIINNYNSSTRRAFVKIALKQVNTNNSLSDYPVLVDVPVIFPSGGGYVLNFPLVSGDAVVLLFSQRDLSTFKEAFLESAPTLYGFFSLPDAVAFAGFGAISNTPAKSGAVNLQNTNGTSSISLTDSEIEVKTTATVTITAPTVTINGDLNVSGNVTSGSISLPNHVHTGVETGGSNTGGPI